MNVRTSILFVAFILLNPAFAATERPVKSNITTAKVFLQGAQVVRTASASLSAGSGTLVFTGLSDRLDPMSIQVQGKGTFGILSVNHRINYLTESPKKKEITELEEKIEALAAEHATEKAIQDVWVNEEHLLQKNSAIGGQQNGLTAAQLIAVNDYVRERMKAVKMNWLAQQTKLVKLDEAMAKLRAQLDQYRGEQPRPTSEIVVEVDVDAETAATFELTYFVPDAGWSPAYDLRAKSTDAPIELLLKAEVVNATGEPWERVRLSLSSGNPTLGGAMPTLHAWVLQQPYALEHQSYRTFEGDAEQKMRAPAAASPEDLSGLLDARREVGNTMVYNTTTVEYAIDAPFSVPADGMSHTVGIRTHSVPATYKHYTTPKLDRDAFLYARTTGWEDLNLLPGNANIFFEGTYVGRSRLNTQNTSDTLDIALGRDKGVVIDRVRRKSTDDKALIGGKRTVTIGFDISVRNTKGTAVELEVRDQMPLSPRSEIEVKLHEAPRAQVNEGTGQLTWSITIAPRTTEKLGFSYTVKHPKEIPVVLE